MELPAHAATAETPGQGTPSALGTSSAPGSPLPVPSAFSAGPLVAGLFLAALAATAFTLARRRRRVPRLVEILESASLGPKQSLVVARMGDEVVLLGSSEGGITLLSTRPAASLVPARVASAAGSIGSPLPESLPSEGRGLRFLRELFPRRRASESPAFEGYLRESGEDLELRRKLAAGQAGSVR